LNNGWKIGFIIVLSLLILHTLGFVFLIGLGADLNEKEQVCRNTCIADDAVGYYDDYVENTCYCEYADGTYNSYPMG
jgi:hypothetical protein